MGFASRDEIQTHEAVALTLTWFLKLKTESVLPPSHTETVQKRKSERKEKKKLQTSCHELRQKYLQQNITNGIHGV